MAFVLKKNPTFEKQIEVFLPSVKAGKDAFEKSTFKAIYKLPTTDELIGEVEEIESIETLIDVNGKAHENKVTTEKIITEGLRHLERKARLRKVITGFSELVDEAGTVIEFNDENLESLISVSQAALALDMAFFTSLYKEDIKAKN